MSLALLVGPANAGKVRNLLDRYVAALDRDPFLVVPNRGEVERIERELLTRVPVLLGGSIGTFDDLFERIARGDTNGRVLTATQRSLLLGGVVADASLGDLARSARFDGFAESLGDAIADLETALVGPGDAGGELGELYALYRAQLARLGLTDRELRRRRAVEIVAGRLEAWNGSPLFVYGFEDLTGAQWALVEALAGRADVHVALPYEPSRAAFESLRQTASDLTELAADRIEELEAQDWYDAPALAHLERVLFTDRDEEAPALDGAVRFLEVAGTRAALELVGEEIVRLLRDGTPAEEIGIVAAMPERLRAPLETVFGAFGIPYCIHGPLRLGRTPFGRALLGLVRFAWLDGSRSDLFAFLRSPYSGLARHRADFVEGRLRGRGVAGRERVEEETVRLLEHPVPALDALRAFENALAGLGDLAASMLRAAWGIDRAEIADELAADLRSEQAMRRTLEELGEWQALGSRIGPDQIVRELERAVVPVRVQDAGRVAVLDLLRARTHRFDVVFVLGLEEGSLPGRSVETPFLPDERRRELEGGRGPDRRLLRADRVTRDRYLFYAACTRPRRRLYLVREAATDEGRPLEPSPFWEEIRSRFEHDDVERWTVRRPLSALAWELHRAPTERERLRSVAMLAAESEAEARSLAASCGWSRQIERALAAFSRPTRLANPAVRQALREQGRFAVTELEQFGDCSSMWLLEKVVQPREIDAELDARLRGGVAHQALYRFYSGLPKRLGVEKVDPDRLDEALEFLRECLDEAIEGQVRIDLPEVELLELEGSLTRDLEHFVRQEVALGLSLVPRRFEVMFGSERAAPELKRGLELGDFTVSGKIDRIDVDPFSARGIVQDYKSGRVAQSAAQIESQRRLQIPLYILALRDLVGVEPLGGLYRALAGEREARGLLRKEASEDLPGLASRDYLGEEAFWAHLERAQARAVEAVARIRDGDIRHDPRGGECPSWCRLWPMCRVERA